MSLAIPKSRELQGIGQIHNNGQSQGNRNNVFSVAGDDLVNGPNFLTTSSLFNMAIIATCKEWLISITS